MPPLHWSIFAPPRTRKGGPVTLSYCWAHLRRRFYEIAAKGPAPIASEALVRIRKLYEIEEEIRGKPPNERYAVRQAKSRPEVEKLQSWFEDCRKRVPKTSPVRDAMNYGLNHWDGLIRFLDDGRIEIDSNTVERSIRPLALTEKIVCSRDMIRAPRIGHAWRRLSRHAS